MTCEREKWAINVLGVSHEVIHKYFLLMKISTSYEGILHLWHH